MNSMEQSKGNGNLDDDDFLFVPFQGIESKGNGNLDGDDFLFVP